MKCNFQLLYSPPAQHVGAKPVRRPSEHHTGGAISTTCSSSSICCCCYCCYSKTTQEVGDITNMTDEWGRVHDYCNVAFAHITGCSIATYRDIMWGLGLGLELELGNIGSVIVMPCGVLIQWCGEFVVSYCKGLRYCKCAAGMVLLMTIRCTCGQRLMVCFVLWYCVLKRYWAARHDAVLFEISLALVNAFH